MLEWAHPQTQPSNPAGNSSNGPAVFHVGGGLILPRAIYAPKPEYSEEARRDKIEGICVVTVVVGQDGVPRRMKVKRTLRPDLDAKAMEAVGKWRFEPAVTGDGKPATIATEVEVEFRLESDNPQVRELQSQADAGDPKAELELSKHYFQGVDVGKSESLGYKLLRQAAEHGFPEAEYEMGEYSSGKNNGSVSYYRAFVWYSLAQRGGYKGSAKKAKKIAKNLSPNEISQARLDVALALYKVKSPQPSK